MEINKLAECFSKSATPIIIICDIENARRMLGELNAATINSTNYGEFKNDKKPDINCMSVLVDGKTIHFVDTKDTEKFCKLTLES
ncbi:hypothetical protein [Flavobacterium sp.]|uniref:hypothetical protein n=1 Tax=Flavobacterium sp. TaxID=239 RepID=UPI003D6BFB5E